jgi:hypothetical protein
MTGTLQLCKQYSPTLPCSTLYDTAMTQSDRWKRKGEREREREHQIGIILTLV